LNDESYSIIVASSPAPLRLQRGVYGSEFVTPFHISVIIFIIHFVPALSFDHMI